MPIVELQRQLFTQNYRLFSIRIGADYVAVYTNRSEKLELDPLTLSAQPQSTQKEMH